MQRSIKQAVFLSILLLTCATSSACVTCKSKTAQEVRNGIFDGHFLKTLVSALAPFPVFFGSGIWIYRLLPLPKAEENV